MKKTLADLTGEMSVSERGTRRSSAKTQAKYFLRNKSELLYMVTHFDI